MFVECEDCKQKFDVSSGEAITHKRAFKINGKSIFLTYYDCPSCGRRHFVQIDDLASLSRLNDVKKKFVKLATLKRRGEVIPERQQARFKKARQHLSDYRMKLMKEYTDTSIYDDETDSNFILRFSV